MLTLIGIIILIAFVIAINMAIGFVCVVGTLIILLAIGCSYVIRGKSEYETLMTVKPSEMKCPNCHSSNVKIDSIKTGSISSGTGTYIYGVAIANGNNRYSFKRIGKCQDCGFDYDYITQEDIDLAKNLALKKQNKGTNICKLVGAIIGIILVISFILYSKSVREEKEENNVSGEIITESQILKESEYLDINLINNYTERFESENINFNINCNWEASTELKNNGNISYNQYIAISPNGERYIIINDLGNISSKNSDKTNDELNEMFYEFLLENKDLSYSTEYYSFVTENNVFFTAYVANEKIEDMNCISGLIRKDSKYANYMYCYMNEDSLEEVNYLGEFAQTIDFDE